MTEVPTFAAKMYLSQLLARVRAGESFTITRRGKPIARITPLAPQQEEQKEKT
jgi:prevent-host-death family protein